MLVLPSEYRAWLANMCCRLALSLYLWKPIQPHKAQDWIQIDCRWTSKMSSRRDLQPTASSTCNRSLPRSVPGS